MSLLLFDHNNGARQIPKPWKHRDSPHVLVVDIKQYECFDTHDDDADYSFCCVRTANFKPYTSSKRQLHRDSFCISAAQWRISPDCIKIIMKIVKGMEEKLIIAVSVYLLDLHNIIRSTARCFQRSPTIFPIVSHKSKIVDLIVILTISSVVFANENLNIMRLSAFNIVMRSQTRHKTCYAKLYCYTFYKLYNMYALISEDGVPAWEVLANDASFFYWLLRIELIRMTCTQIILLCNEIIYSRLWKNKTHYQTL